MTKFEEEFNYLIELSGKVLIGQVDAEAFEKNRVSFFEKYETDQQQALPVVPECVGSFLTDKSILGIANGVIPDDVISWVQEQTYYVDLEKIISHLISLKVTGFTVEKPQLFYLKNKLTTSYLALDTNTGYYEHWGEEIIPKLLKKQGYKISFTQQEIDSMETGSYEQIEVAE